MYVAVSLAQLALTLFHLGGGLFDPLYHESVCRIYRPRTRFTKIHDFVPFGICQDPVKLLLKFFSKKFEILDVKIFLGPSSIRKKWKNFENFFFEKKPKIWNPYGQRVPHIKFEWNRRQKFFSVSKGGPFGVFPIFEVLIHRQWLTLTERNGGSDFFDC